MSITTSIVFKDAAERDYIKRLIAVRRNLQGLVENGALKELPDIIQLAMNATNVQPEPVPKPKQMFVDAADTTPGFGVSVNDFLANIKRPQNQMPQPATVEDEAEEPMVCQWLDNILNGDYFPPVEENTRLQNEFLQNKRFQSLYKVYRKTRAPEVLSAIVKLAEELGINE